MPRHTRGTVLAECGSLLVELAMVLGSDGGGEASARAHMLFRQSLPAKSQARHGPSNNRDSIALILPSFVQLSSSSSIQMKWAWRLCPLQSGLAPADNKSRTA